MTSCRLGLAACPTRDIPVEQLTLKIHFQAPIVCSWRKIAMSRRRTITLGGVAAAVGAAPTAQMTTEYLMQALVEQRTRALTTALVEGLPAAIWCFDMLGQVEISNQAARRATGALIQLDPTGIAQTIGGRAFSELISAKEPQAWDTRTSCGTVSYELRSHLATIEGTTRLAVIASDVTRERAMLARLADAERRAAVGTLGAGVAHEINNPLGFVIANMRSLGEYLLELGRLSGSHQAAKEILSDAPQLLEETERGLQRISGIVRELLHFSARGGCEEPWVTLRMSDIVDQAMRLAGHELKKRARIERSDKPAPTIRGLSRQLGDVVMDLLLNAVDAVERMPQERRKVEVRTYGAGRLAVLEVEDCGVGIPANVVPRVFDPFFTTKPNRQGTGLGLSVASEIVRRHGGEIVLTSREGVGTLVRVEVPGEG
ncbi:MAG: GHKL domain-containing protein [Deltaproteobacteria bacterium]|nr:GHKL domain-containing protein [Deltaproteobacteria bacterium]